jgi:WD40 repeat protein
MSTESNEAYGLSLRHTLRGHTQEVNRIAWSPDGHFLASSSFDGTVCLWDTQTGHLSYSFKEHSGPVYSVAWSDVKLLDHSSLLSSCGEDCAVVMYSLSSELVQTQRSDHLHSRAIYDLDWSPAHLLNSCSKDHTIRTWVLSLHTLKPILSTHISTPTAHESEVLCVAWNPQKYANAFASGSLSGLIRVWERTAKEPNSFPRQLRGHTDAIYDLTWSPNGRLLASCSQDHTIRIWEFTAGHQTHILDVHTDSVTGVSFSYDGQLLASKSRDSTIRIWRTDRWEVVKILQEPPSNGVFAGIAFHPSKPILAAVSERDMAVKIWDLDVPALLGVKPAEPSVYYTNAKVVLVGDSGVGKSALSLVLTGHPFTPPDSTHGRFVYTLDSQVVELDSQRKEQREIFLWDLAGQSGYRLIHQLHLDEAAMALLVFSDNEGNSDSLNGISHWVRALRTAQNLQSDPAQSITKYLVEARVDRGGVRLDENTINEVIARFSLDGYFATSAKEGWDISKLVNAIKNSINWNTLPKVTSTNLFQRIQAFLVKMKEDAILLETSNHLYQLFQLSEAISDFAELQAQFKTCVGRIEAQGLIRRLSFGNLILMQPELIDFYASALINAVRKDPDGLGYIAEARVSKADFYIPSEGRIADKAKEHLLLLAMIEDLLRYELVFREQIEGEVFLIFPSEVTRKNASLSDPMEKAVIFSFEGPVLNIYVTLAIRLSHSNLFIKKELWKDAIIYTTRLGGTFGLTSRSIEEGKGEFTLLFDKAASDEARFQFEEYVKTHLERRALPESIEKTPIFHCPNCKRTLDGEVAKLRRAEGKTDMLCALCEIRVPILDSEERLKARQSSFVSQANRIEHISDIDQAANLGVKREADSLTIQGKEATNDFDVFLCHNNTDKPAVRQIGEKLKELGILPWLDEWELQPGLPWQRTLENQISHIKSAAVFVGKDGIGPWQHQELDAFLREFVRRGCPVIPIILDYAPNEPQLPIFLQGMTWVDFRKQEPEPMSRLIWGITGRRVLSV